MSAASNINRCELCNAVSFQLEPAVMNAGGLHALRLTTGQVCADGTACAARMNRVRAGGKPFELVSTSGPEGPPSR